ncbi:2Fe-2S iron-sulfur cluster-binding protein [Aminobacter aminovorans]|uniref:2Fe-2S iron-sulfur cluster-binding protein n=1 Tax=Aminobacter aminovorans TaxID=83263 RepID=UPI002859BB38|nr:2Fe-2S iron-sulfur cluster-binding protein [Aminobacter aminovorans]MDR7221184.1 CDP-4-dehydro-6-deoxyglucose reductase [Aminobacter aminovorans]
MDHVVRVLETEDQFTVASEESVLMAAIRQGVQLLHDCTEGGCGTCRIRLMEGCVRYEEYPLALTPEDEEEGFALACQARPESDLLISTERPMEPCSDPERYTATVQSVRNVGRDVVHLTLALPGAEELVYRPGQYLNVLLDDGNKRSFSMASVPNGKTVDLHIRRVRDGHFTSGQLLRLSPGDRLDVELPHGLFCCRKEDFRPIVMVATGTGLAPIKSILESLMDDPDCPPVSLYWGMRTEDDLYLHDEIQSWGERLCDFQYVPVLSRPGPGWEGRQGYVQEVAAEDIGDFSEHAIYMCGSPRMISSAKKLFIENGANPGFIYADAFNFQHTLVPAE